MDHKNLHTILVGEKEGKDGHTEVLNPSTTNYDDTKNYNNEEIILKYNGIMDKVGTTKEFSTTMLLSTKWCKISA